MSSPENSSRPRVVVVGAGAAGLLAAIFAAEGGAETILLERDKRGGKKIIVSGGGRCNILPARLDPSRFVTDSSPNSLRKILKSWPLESQIAFFESELGLKLVEEIETAKLFPETNRASDVRDGLLRSAARRGVTHVGNFKVTAIEESGDGWIVSGDGVEPVAADSVILATGGLSVPETGSDGFGLKIVERFGHRVNPLYPALTTIMASPALFGDLSGISLEVMILAESDARSAFSRGGFLFTHKGYSGPAVLDVSHVAVRAKIERSSASLKIRWTELGAEEWTAALTSSGKISVAGVLKKELPVRLVERLLELSKVDGSLQIAKLPREERTSLIKSLVEYELPWSSDGGYRVAEVTGGGVDLAEVDPRTMESRIRPGLFLCGELLDLFGPIGGYNFFWAWATGRAAGLGAASRRRECAS